MTDQGYTPDVSDAWLSLLCGRLESWFVEARKEKVFNAYREWEVSARLGPARGAW